MAGAERRLSVRPSSLLALAAGAWLLSGALPCRAQAPLQAQAARVDPGWSLASPSASAPAPVARASEAGPARPRDPRARRDRAGGPVDTDSGAGAAPRRPSPFAAALAAAWKKGVVQDAVDGYTEVLIACQQEQSMLQTTPFMRSDSQQAHCYRY